MKLYFLQRSQRQSKERRDSVFLLGWALRHLPDVPVFTWPFPSRTSPCTCAVPCRSFLRLHPLLSTMGTLIVGTVLFALMTVVAYFCVSVVWRNDKDSQAYVAAAYFKDERPCCSACSVFCSLPFPLFLQCLWSCFLGQALSSAGDHRSNVVWL